MDSIKSKMLTLSQATSDATARALVYDEELMKNNELADKFEEQVRNWVIVICLLGDQIIRNDSQRNILLHIIKNVGHFRFAPSKRKCNHWKVSLIVAQNSCLRLGLS